MIINVDPVAKPRMTRQDKWKQRPVVVRYRAYCDELRLKVGKYVPGDTVSVVFIVPMPKSWSNKKKALMNGKPHQQTPDIDNFQKAFLDALCESDSHVWDIRAVKLWGTSGKIIIKNKRGKYSDWKI